MKLQTQYIVRKTLAVVCTAALACTMSVALAGCGSQAASSSGSGASGNQVAPAQASSSASAATANQIAVNIDLTNAVGSPEAATTSIPFSEEQLVVNVEKESTALDALQATGRIVVVVGTGNDKAVTGIGGLENGVAGQTSHWTYSVNGEVQTASPATVKLADNDTVVWTFVKS